MTKKLILIIFPKGMALPGARYGVYPAMFLCGDSGIGRWTTIDPLADKYPGWSPYAYSLNNPLNYFDTDGNFVTKRGNGRIYATRWSVSGAMASAILENTPFALASVAYRAYRDDPSNSPSGVDLTMAIMNLGISGGFNAISRFTNEAKTIKNMGNFVSLISTGVPSILLGAKSYKNISDDKRVFKLATSRYVTYNGKKFKLAHYAKKKKFLDPKGIDKVYEYEDETEIELDSDLYNEINSAGRDPFKWFSKTLKGIKNEDNN